MDENKDSLIDIELPTQPVEEQPPLSTEEQARQEKLSNLVKRLSFLVSDDEFPISEEEYRDELISTAASLGYEDILEIPSKKVESLILLKAQMNFYYMLAGKHARNYRVRVEGDMEVHAHQTSLNYLKLASALENRLEDELERISDHIEIIEATRYRVTTNGHVPYSNGAEYK